jgi:Protein of unknown function (DUF3237)
MTLELVPLAQMVAELEAPFVLDGTPAGGRWIFEVAAGTIEGERVRGKLKGKAAADWLVVGPDGMGTLDVRALFETDDGALVFMQYNGRVDIAGGGSPTYVAPRFETGDDRYRWLNKIQAVGKGTLVGSTLTYELYELR